MASWRYEREYPDSERDALVLDLNVRTGVPVPSLQRVDETDTLRAMLDETRRERVVDAEEARSVLDPGEQRRVFEFVLQGSPARRTLLVGSVPSDTFLDTFLVGVPTELIDDGRSMRRVVGRIRRMGGLEAAAARVPWLQPALPLASTLDFGRLSRERMFVRWATDEEASSCPDGRGTYVEEGQHRAIAAAWILTHEPNRSSQRTVPYLRGVNRQGQVWGARFWDVGPRYGDIVVGAALCACAILFCFTLVRRHGPRAPRRKRRKACD